MYSAYIARKIFTIIIIYSVFKIQRFICITLKQMLPRAFPVLPAHEIRKNSELAISFPPRPVHMSPLCLSINQSIDLSGHSIHSFLSYDETVFQYFAGLFPPIALQHRVWFYPPKTGLKDSDDALSPAFPWYPRDCIHSDELFIKYHSRLLQGAWIRSHWQ